MIKISYLVFCDLCQKECSKQEYDCTNSHRFDFPLPTREFSYELQGNPIEICNDCAAPIVNTLYKTIRERGET